MSADQRPPGELPLGDKWLEFVGEGAANTIWALHLAHESGGDAYTEELRQSCDGFLFRIQKHQTNVEGSDSSYTARHQLAYLEESIYPLLNNDTSLVVAHKLVSVSQPLIDEANSVLARMDENHSEAGKHAHLPARARKFVGSRVGPAGQHMLTEDFRPRHRPSSGTGTSTGTGDSRELFAEIKPKWLAQSPTAPRGATTCRNCAVAAKRFAEAPEGQKPKKSDPEKHGCPLHLVNPPPAPPSADTTTAPGPGDLPADWKDHAERIFRCEDPRHSHFLFYSLRHHHILQHLRTLQSRLAHSDTFLSTTPEEPDMELLVAMTLRDCSLFFRYEEVAQDDDGDDDDDDGKAHAAEGQRKTTLRMVDFKLADMDKKTPQKIPGWQETERALIDGGWYGEDKGRIMSRCFLKKGEPDDGRPADLSRLKDSRALSVPYEE